jgi:hypothetical protein
VSRTLTLVPHLIAVIGFFLTHGTSAGLAFASRRERDPARLRRLLDLSFRSLTILYLWAVLLVVFGVVGGFRGHYWDKAWIWIALALMIAMPPIMFAVASSYYAKVRRALGLPYISGLRQRPAEEPADPREIPRLLDSSRPYVVAAIGSLAIIAFVILMVAKPS